MAEPQPRGPLRMIGSAFAYTARNDPWFLPVLVGAELVAIGLISLIALVWGPVYLVLGILLVIVTPLIVVNVRLRRILTDQGGEERRDGSADLP